MTDVFHRNAMVESSALQQDAILFHPQTNKFCILNQTSVFIWDRIRAPSSAEQIAEALSANFAGADSAQALADVRRVLGEFVSLDLARQSAGN